MAVLIFNILFGFFAIIGFSGFCLFLGFLAEWAESLRSENDNSK